MIRRPPRSTRTDTLFPYTTLFRSQSRMLAEQGSDGPGIEFLATDGTGKLWDIQAGVRAARSEEHTSELQSLMRISYAVFCLQKKDRRTAPSMRISAVAKTDRKKTHLNARQ